MKRGRAMDQSNDSDLGAERPLRVRTATDDRRHGPGDGSISSNSLTVDDLIRHPSFIFILNRAPSRSQQGPLATLTAEPSISTWPIGLASTSKMTSAGKGRTRLSEMIWRS